MAKPDACPSAGEIREQDCHGKARRKSPMVGRARLPWQSQTHVPAARTISETAQKCHARLALETKSFSIYSRLDSISFNSSIFFNRALHSEQAAVPSAAGRAPTGTRAIAFGKGGPRGTNSCCFHLFLPFSNDTSRIRPGNSEARVSTACRRSLACSSGQESIDKYTSF